MPRPTVMIADDHLMFAEPSGRYLAMHYDVKPPVVVLERIAEALNEHQPDVLLLDISFGRRSSLAVLADLVNRFPRTRIVMVTGHADRRMMATALASGARGYLIKDDGPAEMLLAIETVLAGKRYVSTELRAHHSSLDQRNERPLSARQQEVLKLLRGGLTEGAIASRLGLSISTIEKHVLAIKRRLGLSVGKRAINWRAVPGNGSGRKP